MTSDNNGDWTYAGDTWITRLYKKSKLYQDSQKKKELQAQMEQDKLWRKGKPNE
jgi:hypothetical protein